MDPGHCVLQQGWDTNNALEEYSAAHEPDFSAMRLGQRMLLQQISQPPIQYPQRKGIRGWPYSCFSHGLDENADEEMLQYEFSKHAPIKDIRLVGDKFIHVSMGFAFVHFHSVEDPTKALETMNGMALEKNGQVLHVAYAKSMHGPVN